MKMSLQFTQDEVHNIQLQYFDSIPSALSLCIIKTGFLFSACEFGNQYYIIIIFYIFYIKPFIIFLANYTNSAVLVTMNQCLQSRILPCLQKI